MDIATGLEALRPWISTGGILGLLVFAGLQLRKLTMQGKIDDRQGFGSLIDLLQRQVATLTTDHENCQTLLTRARNDITGLQRAIITQAAIKAVPLEQQSPTMKEAAERTVRAVLADMERHALEEAASAEAASAEALGLAVEGGDNAAQA